MTYIMGMLFTFIISFINGLERVGITLGAISRLISMLPFNDLGFGWIWFAIVGSAVGLLPIWSLNKVNDKKESVTVVKE